MSEYGLFEADHVAQMEPQRQIQAANQRFAAALDAVHRDHGQFLFAADGVDNFDDRLGAVRKDIVATVVKFVPVYPKVMREVIGSLKAEWRRQADINKEHERDTQNPKDQEGGHRSITINERQRSKVRNDNGDPKGDDVETNTGDGSDSMGKNGHDIPHGDSGKVVKVRQKDERHTSNRRQAAPEWEQTSCKHCGQDIEGPAHGYERVPEGAYWDRGGNVSGSDNHQHEPFRHQGAHYADFDDEAGHDIGSDFAPGTYDRWSETPHRPEEHSAARYAEMQDEPERRALIPEGDFHAYEDRVDRGGPEKVQRDFGQGGDTGNDRAGSEGDHIAAKIALDVYSDWAQSNGLRVASTETLEHYAATGVDDADYFTIAAAIRRAECECDDDDDREEDRDEDDHGAPPAFDSDDSEGGDADSDDDDDRDGGDRGDDADSDSDSDDDSGYEDEDSDGEEPDTGDDDGDSGENPFADDDGSDVPGLDEDIPGPDDGPPGPDEPSANDIPPADDGADSDGVPPGPNSGPPGSDDFGQPGPPDVNPDQFPPDDTQGTAPIDPVLIDQLLGLPPGTVETLIADAVGGQPDDPAQALPGDQPAPWLTAAHLKKATRAERNRAYLEAFERLGFNRLAEDDGGGGAAPADPSVGGSDQLLDTALQAVTQTVDQKTQEFQQMIDPLTQALQAIEYAQTVEQAENPLDVTPPQGTVDVNPSASPAAQGAQEALQGAGGPPGAAPAAPPAQPDPRQQQAALRVAKHHGLGQAAYNMMVTAMSRKHYEHVAEAIRGLPFEHRPGIAASMADMFKTDNGRFNPTQFYTSAGVTAARHAGTDAPDGSTAGDPSGGGAGMGDIAGGMDSTVASDLSDPVTASRRPLANGRQAAANWSPQTELDTFSFPNTKAPAPNDNIAVDNLPAVKAPKTASYDWPTWERRAAHDVEAKGVLDMFKNWSQGQQAKGLNTGAPADAVTKFQTEKPSLGEGQINKLKTTVGVPGAGEGEKISRRTANWFMPKVAGWDWDDYQDGYLSKTARDFETPCCHSVMPVPSHGNCKCGKLWNGYGIGNGDHLASGSAEQFIVREIPVRDGVIMAGRNIDKTACWPGCHEDEEHARKFHKDKESRRRVAEEERSYAGEADYNKEIDDPGYDVAEDVQWEPDEDREDADAPHAPAHNAGLNPFLPRTADWTKYDEPDPARKGGPRNPPSTKVNQPPEDWAKRDEKGNWQGPAIPKR
jgi:hypothetical protein